ncbi:MAG: RagB/SusD family nutrient uptake outer membrane protein [Bacteroidota bacterium]
MKHILQYLLVTGIILLGMGSCSEDFLVNPPAGAFSEENYIQNVAELESLLFSCYAVINAYSHDWPYVFINMGVNLFVHGNVGSDDSEKGSFPTDGLDMQDISLSMQKQDNDWAAIMWIINYDLIGKCNLVLDHTMKISGDPEKIESIADQAKFLRALGYYNLVTLYGDVPLITHWTSPSELDLERAPADSVWTQVIQDLKDAANLPAKSQTEIGRITHGAVHALLGKTYMWQKEWNLALEAYQSIIESGEYSLMDDFGEIHRIRNCDESILEFQQASHVEGGHMFSVLGSFRLPRELRDGWGFDTPTQDLVEEFEAGDPRLLYTVNFVGDTFPAPEGFYVVENQLSATTYSSRKAWIPFDELPGDGRPPAYNWRYCRYAEVLLFCAEALNEAGRQAEAQTYLNLVRKRARNTSKRDPQRISSVWDSTYTGELLPNITTSDQVELREAIWHEQRVELAQEGHRRWVLLRTGQFKERMEAAKGALGCSVEDHEWLYPIHPDETEVSNGKIIQNPGYN